MKKYLPSREWRILILSTVLAVSCAIYFDALFMTTLGRQERIEQAAMMLAEDREQLARKLQQAVNGSTGGLTGAACMEKAAKNKAGELALIEERVGAKPTAENIFGFCMKRYYGSEMACIEWLNDEMRAALSRYTAARAGCLAQ